MKTSELIGQLQKMVERYGDTDVTLSVDNVTRDRVKGGQVNVDTYNIDVEWGDGEVWITGDADND